MEEDQELPTSCKDALAQGAKYYFTSKPCKHGHVARRKTSNGTCAECQRVRTRRWREKNVDHCAEYYRQYYEDNKDRHREWMRHWRAENPHLLTAYGAKRRAAKLQATPKWADQEAITRKYETAQFAQEMSGEPCHVDHIVPLQGEEVCGLHVAENLRVVHATENLSKGNQHVFDELEVVAAPNTD